MIKRLKKCLINTENNSKLNFIKILAPTTVL